eukprot:366163-Chlamydomonas_euryale.AAC.2
MCGRREEGRLDSTGVAGRRMSSRLECAADACGNGDTSADAVLSRRNPRFKPTPTQSSTDRFGLIGGGSWHPSRHLACTNLVAPVSGLQIRSVLSYDAVTQSVPFGAKAIAVMMPRWPRRSLEPCVMGGSPRLPRACNKGWLVCLAVGWVDAHAGAAHYGNKGWSLVGWTRMLEPLTMATRGGWCVWQLVGWSRMLDRFTMGSSPRAWQAACFKMIVGWVVELKGGQIVGDVHYVCMEPMQGVHYVWLAWLAQHLRSIC